MRLKYFHDSLNIALILALSRECFCAKCPTSYGMKLNEVHFSSGTVITHFLDKPYQEIDLKNHLNSVLLCK